MVDKKSKHVGRRRSRKLQKNLGKVRKTKKVMRGGEIECFVVEEVKNERGKLFYKCPLCDTKIDDYELYYRQINNNFHKKDSVCINAIKIPVKNEADCENAKKVAKSNELKKEILNDIRANDFRCLRYYLGENLLESKTINENDILLNVLLRVDKESYEQQNKSREFITNVKCNNETIYLKRTGAFAQSVSLEASKDKEIWVTIFSYTDH
jgi:hypothetical protein